MSKKGAIAHAKQANQSVAMSRIRHRTIALFIDRGFLAFKTLVRGGVTAFGAWEGHDLIKSLADGKVDWNAVLAAILAGRVSHAILLTVTTLSLGVAAYQTKLRRTVTSQQASYIQKLELMVDPKRSGSKLLPDGKVRKEDKDED